MKLPTWVQGLLNRGDRELIHEADQPRRHRLLLFFGHAIVYFPLLIIFTAGMALSVSFGAMALFTLFAATTIAMEICISSVVRTIDRVTQFGYLARQALKGNNPNASLAEACLEKAKNDCILYILLTIITLVGWTVIVIAEVKHIGGEPLSFTLVFTAGIAGAFNVVMSFVKLWRMAEEECIPEIVNMLTNRTDDTDHDSGHDWESTG